MKLAFQQSLAEGGIHIFLLRFLRKRSSGVQITAFSKICCY